MRSSSYAFNPSIVSLIVSCIIGLSCILSLVVPSGYSYGFALLLLSSIPLLLWRCPPAKFIAEDYLFLGALLAYFVFYAVGSMVHGLPLRSYEGPSRFLFAVFILRVLVVYPPRITFWWGGVGLGAIAGGFLAFWQVFIQQHLRANGFMNAIQFGDLSMLLGALSIAGVIWAYKTKRKYWVILLSFSVCMGLAGSLLSGTRGGWLVLPFISLALYFLYCKKSRRCFLLGGIGLVFAGLYLAPQVGMQPRVKAAVSDIQHYVDGTEVNTPVGTRLEMWRVSLVLIAEHPLLGWGDVRYIRPMTELIADNNLRYEVSQLDHVHNDMLDALIKRGIVGLLALWLVFFLPLIIFWKKVHASINSNNYNLEAFSVAGIILVLCTFTFGLSQTFFIHNSGTTVYAFYLVVIWAYLRNAQLGQNNTPVRMD